jgi:hypothetical protein
VALENDEDLLILQVPALELSVWCGVQGDPQRPGESFSREFEESYLWFALLVLHTERVVLLACYAFASPIGRLLSSTCSLPARRLARHRQHLRPPAALALSRPRLSPSSSPPNTA